VNTVFNQQVTFTQLNSIVQPSIETFMKFCVKNPSGKGKHLSINHFSG